LSTLEYVERRLLGEYLDLPGLSLTLAQAARLLGVDARTCEALLNKLVNARCLAHGASGTYVRDTRYADLATWKRVVRRRLGQLRRL
jgi:Fic family protein